MRERNEEKVGNTKDMAGRNRWMWIMVCLGMAGAGLMGCGGSADNGMDHTGQSSGSAVGAEDSGTDAETDLQEDDIMRTGETVQGTGNEPGLSNGNTTEVTDVSYGETIQLEGVKLSILGDSLSTYEGWIPEACTKYFPENGALTDVSETWWMQLLDETGMELCANNSSAGSTCVGDSLYTGEVKYGCSGDRLSLLTGSQGKMPDIIIVYMGANDLMNGIPIGDNDGTKLVEEGEIDNFSDAYTLILDKLSSEYPAAQIYCCGLHQMGDWGTEQPFVTFTNHLGLTAEDYSKQIETIAANKGIPYIDLYHCGIEIDNLDQMTSDGVHFTPLGMGYVKEAVLAGLTRNFG
ncbi:MAG: GDSL-type esterase/lipase family protein [Lachnospiraceae bacterium]|nr:GDSL-type esterase/lipase family protein [Lachnospiraceae bacterium]